MLQFCNHKSMMGQILENCMTIIPTTDFVLRQKEPTAPLEIWVDVLVTDSVGMHNKNKFPARVDNRVDDVVLNVQTAPTFTRTIALDEHSQTLLEKYGAKMVLCGPSGIVAEGVLDFG